MLEKREGRVRGIEINLEEGDCIPFILMNTTARWNSSGCAASTALVVQQELRPGWINSRADDGPDVRPHQLYLQGLRLGAAATCNGEKH
jgi:hypothetical protein